MSTKVRPISDLFKSLAVPSDLNGKSVVMTDSNGGLSKTDAELLYFKFKCLCLFGTDDVVVVKSNYSYTVDEWKANLTKAEDRWGGFTMQNSSEGTILVLFAKTDDERQVILYGIGLDVCGPSQSTLRAVDNRLVEIQGYQPLWSSRVPAIP